MKTLLLVCALLLSSMTVLANTENKSSNQTENQAYTSLKTLEIFQVKQKDSYINLENGTNNDFPCYGIPIQDCICVIGTSECPYWDMQ